MHRGPNWPALRAPVQFLTGCGSRQRRSPTGGCAKGMPLKLRTPSLGVEVDSRMPFAVVTRSAARAGNTAALQMAAQITTAWKRKRIRGLIWNFRLGIPTTECRRLRFRGQRMGHAFLLVTDRYPP